eukprot:2581159-Lingulodinium_polyedra.AAC.1
MPSPALLDAADLVNQIRWEGGPHHAKPDVRGVHRGDEVEPGGAERPGQGRQHRAQPSQLPEAVGPQRPPPR